MIKGNEYYDVGPKHAKHSRASGFFWNFSLKQVSHVIFQPTSVISWFILRFNKHGN